MTFNIYSFIKRDGIVVKSLQKMKP